MERVIWRLGVGPKVIFQDWAPGAEVGPLWCRGETVSVEGEFWGIFWQFKIHKDGMVFVLESGVPFFTEKRDMCTFAVLFMGRMVVTKCYISDLKFSIFYVVMKIFS